MKPLLVGAIACAAIACAAISATSAMAAEITVPMNLVDAKGVGAVIGEVRIVETGYGIALYPNLKGLSPGFHGFHVHEKPSCETAEQNGAAVPALAAGGHLDPAGTKKHAEPWGSGHLGDLPPLFVMDDGYASNPVHSPRLKLADIKRRALVVHVGPDNFSDQPAPLGGGGARLACGVIGD